MKSLKHIAYMTVLPLLIVGSAQIYAESIRFDRLSLEDGLSQSTVYAIAQDSAGFIWIGTQDGLNKYDGYQFTIYKNDPFDPNTLSDNYITSILKGRDGTLWIGTFGGVLNRFDPRKNIFIRFPTEQTRGNRLGGNAIRQIFEDPDESLLWLATSGGGLYAFDPQRSSFVRYQQSSKNNRQLRGNHVWSIVADRFGKMWIATDGGGLHRFNRLSSTFESIALPADNAGASTRRIRSVFRDNDGFIWIGTLGNGLYRMEQISEEKRHFEHFRNDPTDPASLSGNQIWTIFQDRSNTLWVGTRENGLNRVREGPDGELRFDRYRHDPADPGSLINNIVISMYEDVSGIIWIAGFGGLSKFNPRQRKFNHIKLNTARHPQLIHNVVMSVIEASDGTVWAGTFGGLKRLAIEQGISANGTRNITLNSIGHYGSVPNVANTLSENRVWSIIEDRRGKLWVGTLGGLNHFDPKSGKSIRYLHNPADSSSISGNRIWSLLEDRNRTIWVGTDGGGLNKILPSPSGNPVKTRFETFRFQPGDSTSLSNNSIRALFERDGILWIGTFGGGLNRLDPATRQFTRYQNDPEDLTSLSNNRIFSILGDRSGGLWIGTDGGGLNYFDPRTAKFKHFTEKNSLPNNVVYGILSDDDGYLWLSSNNGLSRFDPRSETFRNYDVDDGVQSPEFNQGAYGRGKSGLMYFAGINGLNVFYPSTISENPFTPPIAITAVKKFDRPVNLEAYRDKPLLIGPGENFVSFEFAALDYTNPGKNQYAYMLEGFDTDWIYSDTRRYASYTNLDGGDYVFRVRGSNSDRIWNEKGVSLNITVTPPFWKTWWFQVLNVLALAGIILLIYRNRVKKLLEVERTRLRIARDLHDEVSATLSSISYFAQAIRNAMPEKLPDLPRRFLELITESATEAQESMNDIIWSINPENDQWSQMLAKFRRYASDLFESRNIEYQMTLPEQLPAGRLNMEKRRGFWLIFKEMTTNAARHSGGSRIRIDIAVKGHAVELVVEDNGKGFDPQLSTSRNGVKNIHARAEALDGTLNLDTCDGGGTRWTLTFEV